MGSVIVKCPTTGRDIATGMRVDAASFYRSPVFFARTYCPVCHKDHEWFARDAWVHEDEERPRADRPGRYPRVRNRL